MLKGFFDIAGVPFNDVSPDELKIYTASIEQVGSYAGYKPRQFWVRHIPHRATFAKLNCSRSENRHGKSNSRSDRELCK